jgi:hypothetical protein
MPHPNPPIRERQGISPDSSMSQGITYADLHRRMAGEQPADAARGLYSLPEELLLKRGEQWHGTYRTSVRIRRLMPLNKNPLKRLKINWLVLSCTMSLRAILLSLGLQ